jgi:hypothetical protein
LHVHHGPIYSSGGAGPNRRRIPGPATASGLAVGQVEGGGEQFFHTAAVGGHDLISSLGAQVGELVLLAFVPVPKKPGGGSFWLTPVANRKTAQTLSLTAGHDRPRIHRTAQLERRLGGG